jgi:anti-sigma28 factor (negative regulator of flagellin synthesis)
MIDLTQLKTAEQKAAEAAQQQREQRIAELKALLNNSDYKVLPDYDKDSEAIKAQRQAWREEIRTLEGVQP